MTIEIGLSQAALGTESTIDFTSSKLSSSPVGIFGLVGDGSVNGTDAADWRLSYGFTDGATDGGINCLIEDGDADTTVRREAGPFVCEGVHTGSDRLTHNQFLENGWRASLSNESDLGRLALACMFGGSDVTVETGTTAVGDGTQQTITLSNTSLTPTIILFASVGDASDDSSSTFFNPSFGIAYNAGVGIVQRMWAMSEGNAESSGNPEQVIRTDAIAEQMGTWQLSVESISEGQFQYTANADSGSDEVSWIAIQFDNANIALVDTDTPTTTGIDEQTGPGFTPKFVMQVNSMLTSVDSITASAEAGALNFSLFNDTEAFSYSYAHEDGASTINTQCMAHDRAVFFDADDGTLAFDGTFSSFTSNGWEINYSTVDGTTRKGFALAIGEATSGISGTTTQTLGSITQDGSGALAFSGSATQTLASVEQDASGSTLTDVSGDITQTLGAISQSASGSLSFSATVSQTLASITQSLNGSLAFSATVTQTLGTITQDASGSTSGGASGDIAQTLASITQSAEAQYAFSATSTQTLPAIIQAASESEPTAPKLHELDYQKRGHFARGSLRRKR